MKKSEVLKLGKFPDEFLKDLISPVPSINVDFKIKLKWLCPVHGVYEQRIINHLEGNRCPKCSRYNNAVNCRKKSLQKKSEEYEPLPEGIVTKAQVIKAGRYPKYFLDNLISPEPSIFESGNTKLIWNCPIHGKYEQSISSHLQGRACYKCALVRVKDNNPYHGIQNNSRNHKPLPEGIVTKSDVVAAGHYPEYFLKNLVSPIPSPLEDGAVKLIWHCEKHGDYQQSIKSHLKGQSCYKCGREKMAISRSLSSRKLNPFPDWFLKDLESSPDKDYVLSGAPTYYKVTWKCSKHGEYKQSIEHHLRYKRGCPICAQETRSQTLMNTMRSRNPFPQWFLDEMKTSPDYEKILNNTVKIHDKIAIVCPDHGVYYQDLDNHLRGSICPQCAQLNRTFTSNIEKELFSILTELGIKTILDCRTVIKSPVTGKMMELDLYCPDYKIAIECNGLKFHSYENMEESRGYNALGGSENYHKMKTDLCLEQGIQLIHLYEDDLRDRFTVCVNLILSKIEKGKFLKRTAIGARQCESALVPIEDAKVFYDKFHINGIGHGICYGLYYKDILVSLMQIRKAANNTVDKGSWILDRYATNVDYFVIGGFEKLFKFCIDCFDIHRFISYADKSVSNGSIYRRTGWNLVGEIKPDYTYVYKGCRYHKFNFRIKRFKTDSNLEYIEGYTERQLAELNGLTRIYDSGKLKYEYVVK